MSRSDLALLALVLVASSVDLRAQAASARGFRPILAPVRAAGTLHLADGSWTRKANAVSLGWDVLYDNTCDAHYFASLSGDTYVDEGYLPAPNTPDTATLKPGCATSYTIDGFQISYCTDQSNAAFTYSFYDHYSACSSVVGVTPVASFALTGLPGVVITAQSCWTVNIDASSTPFVLSADFTGSTNQSLFGFAISSPQTSLAHGPRVAGDDALCSRFDGTSWDPIIDPNESGTGMGSLNQFRIESGPSWPACRWFGGDPFASFWLELYGDTCAPDESGQVAFCLAGEIAMTACPCANDPLPGAGSGCRNSFGIGAILSGTGAASLSADTVTLIGTQMPANSPVLYFQGTLRHFGGFGQVFGDGLRCAGGPVTRLGTAINSSAGSSQYPSGAQPAVSVRGSVIVPGTRTYQGWYRNVAAFCTPAGFNLTNGWEILWRP